MFIPADAPYSFKLKPSTTNISLLCPHLLIRFIWYKLYQYTRFNILALILYLVISIHQASQPNIHLIECKNVVAGHADLRRFC